MQTRLALNSYTLREKLQSPEQIKETFRKVSEIGYRAVELDLQPLLVQMDRAELKSLLRELDLLPFSAHVEFEALEYNLEGTLDDCKFLELEYVVVPNLPRERFCKDAKGYREGTKMLRSYADAASKLGMKLAYHNHAREFERFDGKLAMDMIFGEGSDFPVEIDVYWVQYGGGDPAQWLEKYSGRVPMVHLKDFGMDAGKQVYLDVGAGNLNWPAIFQACRKAGVEWYIVEHDEPADPLESVKQSKTNLDKMGVLSATT